MLPLKSFDLPILLYHHIVSGQQPDARYFEISIEQFEEHLDLLQKLDFTTINFARLLHIAEGSERSPSRPVLISFDDGFESFSKLAVPELLRRKMTATVFVPVGEIGGSNRWDIERAMPPRKVMSEVQLKEVDAAGMEIGVHGWAHRNLLECTPEEAREEIIESRKHLQSLGFAADVFAYPFSEYSKETYPFVKEAGYSCAAAIFSDAPSVTADRFAMRRVYIHPADTSFRLRLKLSSPYLKYKAWRGKPVSPPNS